ncbi:hypothetical protein V6U90_15935 [Micromonospora sp. CPCC 206060]|uniref:hypothetical protein n=1 Tax=Micromonospora sp. CPCC 206060 TaxID=3122406 RepID=UPI002FF1B587
MTKLAAPTATALVCTQRIEIPTFNAEFVPAQDGGPCTARAVAKLVTEHGNGCMCGGLCLVGNGMSAEPTGPWTEEQLFCAQHLEEYERAIFASERYEARGGETLTHL